MKNIQLIFLSILRFFKLNVVSLIGFMLLVFFSVSIFTTLNAATSTLSRSFNRIKIDGNLHDFVINENYSIGEAKFTPVVKLNTMGNYDYNFTINEGAWTNGHKKTQEEFKKWIVSTETENEFSKFFLGNEKLFFYFDKTGVTETIYSNSNESKQLKLPDFITATSLVDAMNQAKLLLNDSLISPLNDLVPNVIPIIFKNTIIAETNNNVAIRNFSALDISTNKQNMFFKIIETNRDYNVDNLVIFEGNNVSVEEDFSGFINSLQREYAIDPSYFVNINPKDANVKPNEPLPPNANLDTKILYWTWKYIELFLKSSWTPGYIDTNGLLNKLDDNIYANVNPWRNSPIDLSFFDSKDQSRFKDLFIKMRSFLTQEKGHSIINTGFSLTFSKTSLLPAVGVINDINSFESLATPSYFSKDFFDETTKETYRKEPIDINLWNEVRAEASEDEFQNWLLKGLPEKNKLEVDNEIFVLLGSGLSPDFMYPIIDQNRPIPDQSKEELIYVSNSGYMKVENNFRGSLTENFIVGKSNGGNLSKQIRDINTVSTDFMSWPTGIDSTYSNDDLRNIFSPASQRVVFIPSLIDSINLISLFLTSFIATLTLIVIGIMIKRFIAINKTDLAILLANGFSKWELVLALTLIILLFSGIATILGIFAGIALQIPAIGLFSQFWTLPTSFSNLTVGLFFGIFGVAMLTFGLMSLLFSYLSLRGEIVDLMKNDSNYHLNRLSRLIKKSVRKRSILTIFRVSLAFSSPWKIISISTMSAIVMSSLSFGISSIDKFGVSARNTFESKQYENAIDLYSPTNAGGLYYTTPLERISTTLFNGLYNFNENLNMDRYNEIVFAKNPKEEWNDLINPLEGIAIDPINQQLIGLNNQQKWRNNYTNKPASNFSLTDHNMTLNGNLHLPTLQDADASIYDLSYVEYKTSSKLSLEHQILFFIPWSIAFKLMPSNTGRYFNENYEILLEEVYRYYHSFDAKSASPPISTKWDPELFSVVLESFVKPTKINENNNRSKFALTYTDSPEPNPPIEPYYLTGNAPNYGLTKEKKDPTFLAYGFIDNSIGLSLKLKEDFINLIYGIEKNNNLSPTNYSMNYKKIPIGPEDETYTTVEFNIINKNGYSFPHQSLRVKGIKENSKHVSLLNNGVDIKSLINVDIKPENITEIEIPIIANKFAEKSLNLNVGDKLEINVLNDIMRFEDSVNNIPEDGYNFKIMGFNDSFKDNEFYMSQENANLLTKITTLQKPIKDFSIDSQNLLNVGNNKEWLYGFNGIFTSDVNIPQTRQSISLYSPYNIYLGFDKISNPGFSAAMKTTKTGNAPKNKEESNFYDALERTKSIDLMNIYMDKNYPVLPKDITIKSFIDSIISTYKGESTFISLITSVEPVDVLRNIFINIQNMTEILQWISLIIINIASVIIILLITLIIISDSMKLAGILKALGLRSLSNASSFLMIYLPVIILGLIVAIPLTFLFNFIYSITIFNFMGILISTTAPWWVFLLSSSVIIFIFLISFLITWRKIKTQKLTEVIK